MLSLIVAIARNGIIGKDNQIPWHLPADLKYFKDQTTGKVVVMGKNTYNSIAGYLGHGLPNRENVVLTDDPDFSPSDATTFPDVASVVKYTTDKDAFIIGGRMVYETFLPLVDKLYITWVESDIDGDTKFPDIDFADFTEISSTPRPRDAQNKYDLTFAIYERRHN